MRPRNWHTATIDRKERRKTALEDKTSQRSVMLEKNEKKNKKKVLFQAAEMI
jgi:hypothetical protein